METVYVPRGRGTESSMIERRGMKSGRGACWDSRRDEVPGIRSGRGDRVSSWRGRHHRRGDDGDWGL